MFKNVSCFRMTQFENKGCGCDQERKNLYRSKHVKLVFQKHASILYLSLSQSEYDCQDLMNSEVFVSIFAEEAIHVLKVEREQSLCFLFSVVFSYLY